MMRVILRADDIGAGTNPAALHRVYDPCWERGRPVCFSVIPRAATRFAAGGPEAMAPANLRENNALCKLLVELVQAGLAEVALHGWEHRPGELVEGSVAALAERLEGGLAILREALPGVPIRVLVPPHDALSSAGLRAARQLGLRVCSSWAACHGDTRLAHWWSRIRRLAGATASPLKGECWATDDGLLDFGAPAAQDRPATERLLAKAPRKGRAFALTQHYWRLLDADGTPNARHARWLSWLQTFVDGGEVELVRYGD